MADPTDTPERELELIRLAVAESVRLDVHHDGVLCLMSPTCGGRLHRWDGLYRRLVELGRLVEQHALDAETRRGLEEA